MFSIGNLMALVITHSLLFAQRSNIATRVQQAAVNARAKPTTRQESDGTWEGVQQTLDEAGLEMDLWRQTTAVMISELHLAIAVMIMAHGIATTALELAWMRIVYEDEAYMVIIMAAMMH